MIKCIKPIYNKFIRHNLLFLQVLTGMFFLHKFRNKHLISTDFKAMGIKQVLKVNEVLNCFVEPRWTVALQVQ